MEKKQLEAGIYEGRPIDWSVREIGQKNTPAVEILFQVKQGETKNYVKFTGYLTEKALTKTAEQLSHCGFSDPDLSRFSEGKLGKALDTEKTVSLTVETEMDK